MLRVKEVAKEKGITFEEIAKQLNINRVSISRMINGNPTIESLQKMANVLGVNVKDLFQDNENHISGYIEYKETIHKVNSIQDLKNLIQEIEQQ